MAIQAFERSGGNVQVVIADVLTPADAVGIRELAQQLGPGAGIAIDVRSARSCPAHSLLMLCSIRTRAGVPLAFVGLSAANQRLLHYLGLDPGPPRGGERGRADPD